MGDDVLHRRQDVRLVDTAVEARLAGVLKRPLVELATARHDDVDRHVGAAGAELARSGETVWPRHVDIEQDEVGRPARRFVDRLVAVVHVANFVTIALLPDQIREQYGFSPVPPAFVRKALVRAGGEYVKRAVLPLLPARVRLASV